MFVHVHPQQSIHFIFSGAEYKVAFQGDPTLGTNGCPHSLCHLMVSVFDVGIKAILGGEGRRADRTPFEVIYPVSVGQMGLVLHPASEPDLGDALGALVVVELARGTQVEQVVQGAIVLPTTAKTLNVRKKNTIFNHFEEGGVAKV